MIEFFENYDFWLTSVFVLIICSIFLAYIGLWIVFKNIDYVPLSLSQISSLGIVVYFIVNAISPYFFSIVLTLIFSIYFAYPKEKKNYSVVFSYLFSSSLTLFLGNYVRHDIVDINSILFGNAILIESEQVYVTLIVSVFILLIHLIYYKKFLYVSFDPISAKVSGVNVFKIDLILFFTIGMLISVSTKSIGMLPVFAFTIIPPLTALIFAKSMRFVIFLSIIISVLASFVGYYISFTKDTPLGATITLILSIIFIIAKLIPFKK